MRLISTYSYGLMSGSFTALGSIASGLSRSVNITSGTFASDANKLATKEAVAEQMGKEFSFAESLHYQQVQSGIKSGIETGINFNNDFANKIRYDAQLFQHSCFKNNNCWRNRSGLQSKKEY